MPTFILLTHERELTRESNSGRIAKTRLGQHCQQVVWQRKAPDPALLALIAQQQVGLLFPAENSTALPVVDLAELNLSGELGDVSNGTLQQENFTQHLTQHLAKPLPKYFILLDATWQEAGKMYRQSPYLQSLPSYRFTGDYVSGFTRRRNQQREGLCTLESIAVLCALSGDVAMAGQLLVDLQYHNQKAFDC